MSSDDDLYFATSSADELLNLFEQEITRECYGDATGGNGCPKLPPQKYTKEQVRDRLMEAILNW